MEPKQKSSSSAFVIFGVSAVFIVGVLSLFLGSSGDKKTIDELAGIKPSPTSQLGAPSGIPSPALNQAQQDPTSSWKGYAIPFLKISVKVPPEWFIVTDQSDKSHVQITSASPEANLADKEAAFKLDINKLKEGTKVKNIVDLRIELTKNEYKESTQKGKIAGESEVKIDNLVGLYRELQTQTGAIQQLYLVTADGDVGVFESVPHDENQINIFKIIISVIKNQT